MGGEAGEAKGTHSWRQSTGYEIRRPSSATSLLVSLDDYLPSVLHPQKEWPS